jgi:hypothetical protein
MGWMPLVIRPRQVVSHKPPPTAKAKQDEVLRQIDAPKAAVRSDREGSGWLRFTLWALFAGILASSGLILVWKLKLYRDRFVTLAQHQAKIGDNSQHHRRLLDLSAQLLAMCGATRSFGETWEAFAARLSTETSMKVVAPVFAKLVWLNASAETKSLDQAGMNEIMTHYTHLRKTIKLGQFIKILIQLKNAPSCKTL